MYTLSINMWFQKLMKQFFFGIDQVVYNFIGTVYDLLISIARTSILSQADIIDMSDRIYKLLAVFMIFKVTLSLITYVVNPDDFSDKSKGISKLITNIIISLGLLILTPYIFSNAYKLQTNILKDNTLATLIFSKGEAEKEDSGDFINTAGDEIAFIAMSGFFTPNISIPELEKCVELIGNDGLMNPACSGIDNINYNECNESTCQGVDLANTMKGLADPVQNNNKDDNPNFAGVENYVVGVNKKNLGLMFRAELAVATDKDNSVFVMDYKYIFSTVVGVVIVLLLITFCMDVALRSIKLSFLQLISPIPILSYIDPKSGKDGMFKKWYQLCFKTYLSLFIRLLALYFAIYLIGRVNSMVDIVDGSHQTNIYVKIFVIIGALMFAKDFPKILENLGIKLDGDGKFFLNPLKKFSEQAAGGKQILGLGAAGLAGGAAFASNLATTGSRFKNAKGFWGKTGAALSSVGGAFGATKRGVGAALKGEKPGKVFTNSYSGAMKAKHDRAQRNADGVTLTDYWGSKIGSTLGAMSYTEQVKFNDLNSIDKRIDTMKPQLDHAKEIKRNSDMVKGAKGQFSDLVAKAPGVENKQLFLDEVERRSLADYMDGKYTSGYKLDEAAARDQMERDKKDAKSERDAAIKAEMQKRISNGDVEIENKISELRVSAENAGIDLNGQEITIFDDSGKPKSKVTLFNENGEFIGTAEDLWSAVGFNSELTTQARNVSANNAQTINDITIETERLQKQKSDITTSDEYKAKKTAEEYASKK